jgi:hypothetical protein
MSNLDECSACFQYFKVLIGFQFIDGLPTHICLSCCTQLKEWDTFIQVFTNSQQLFKQQLDSDSQASSMSISPPGMTPSPIKMPLPPKKRKFDSMLVTSSLLSPCTSSTPPILNSPAESSGGGIEGEAAHGSETDDASECPPEFVQERLNLSRPFKAHNNRGRKMQPVPLFRVQQQANYFQHGRVSFFF